MVLFPEPERPVNHSTAGRAPRLPKPILFHARSCSQNRMIFDANSSAPTARETASLRVKTNTSSDVAMVPRTLHESAFATDLT